MNTKLNKEIAVVKNRIKKAQNYYDRWELKKTT